MTTPGGFVLSLIVLACLSGANACNGALYLQGSFFPQLSKERVLTIMSTALGVPSSLLEVSVSGLTSADGSSTFTLTTKQAIDNSDAAVLTLVKKLDTGNFEVADINVVKLQMTSGGVTATIFQYKTVESKAKLLENNMWWLVFLVLLLPIISILVRQAYRKGKKRERRRNQDAIATGRGLMPQQTLQKMGSSNNLQGSGSGEWGNQNNFDNNANVEMQGGIYNPQVPIYNPQVNVQGNVQGNQGYYSGGQPRTDDQ